MHSATVVQRTVAPLREPVTSSPRSPKMPGAVLVLIWINLGWGFGADGRWETQSETQIYWLGLYNFSGYNTNISGYIIYG